MSLQYYFFLLPKFQYVEKVAKRSFEIASQVGFQSCEGER